MSDEIINITIQEDHLPIIIDTDTPELTITDNHGIVTIVEAGLVQTVIAEDNPNLIINNGGYAGTVTELLDDLLGKLTRNQMSPGLASDLERLESLWNRIGSELLLTYSEGLELQEAGRAYTDSSIIDAVADITLTTDGKIDAAYSLINQTASAITQTVTQIEGDLTDRFVVNESLIAQTADSISSVVTRLDTIDGPGGSVELLQSSILQTSSAIDLEVTARTVLEGVVTEATTSISLLSDSLTLASESISTLDDRVSSAELVLGPEGINLSVLQEALSEHEYSIGTFQTLLANQWGVTIEETVNGDKYATGFGLILHPTWLINESYSVGFTVVYNEVIYKCLVAHTSSEINSPLGVSGSTYWAALPDGVRSAFTVQADSFKVLTSAGPTAVFEVTDDVITLNTTVVIGSGSTGYSNIDDAPTSLETLDATAYADLQLASTYALQAISDAANAQSTADGKITAFYQTNAPTYNMDIGDFWIDIDDNNKMYTYTGSEWVVAQDQLIGNAINLAQTAQTTADGKAVVFYSSTTPSEASAGDLWYDTDDTQKSLYRYDGSGWDVVSTNGALWDSNITDQPLNSDIYNVSQWRNGFEETDANWHTTSGHALAYTSSDVFSGTLCGIITTSTVDTDSSGTVGGAYITIPTAIALVFAGRRIIVGCYAKKPSSGGASKFSIAYSTSEVGNSGWQEFTPTTSWANYTFTYDVPAPLAGGPDYLGIQGFTDGDIYIDNVFIILASDFEEIANKPTSLSDLNSTEYNQLLTAVSEASQALQDAATAQSTADGKITSFYQITAPTTGMDTGDFWIDTDDGNKMYRYSGTSWVAVQDDAIGIAINAAQTAQTTADGKAVCYYQTSAPVGASTGDLWYDTDDTSKRLYRYNGTSWLSIATYGAAWGVNIINQPSSLADLNSTEYTNLITAAENASQAIADAASAQVTADGKINSFYQSSAPTTGMSTGDFWVDTDGGNAMYRYNGSSWIAIQDDAIATALDAAQTAQTTADGKAVIFYQTTTPTTGQIGDLWYNSDTKWLTRWSGSAWVVVGNSYANTSDLFDDALLGQTAIWNDVTGVGKPADYADRTSDVVGDMAYEDVVELAKLGETIISGGYIKTDLIQTSALVVGGIIGQGNLATQDRSDLNYTDGADVTAQNSYVPYITWEYRGTSDGFTSSNITVINNGDSVRLIPTAIDPVWEKKDLSIDGSIYNIIRCRIKRISGSSWDGKIYFSTLGGHTYSASYYYAMPAPTSFSTYQTIVCDMSNLTAGGTDWITHTITEVRFDFSADATSVYEVDWISIGKMGVDPLLERNVANGADVTADNIAADTANIGGTSTATVLSTIDSKALVYSQNTFPAEATAGDLWYYPFYNKFYRFIGGTATSWSSWELVSTIGATWGDNISNQPTSLSHINSSEYTVLQNSVSASDLGAIAYLDTVNDGYITAISGGKISTGVITGNNSYSYYDLNNNKMYFSQYATLEFGSNAKLDFGQYTVLAGNGGEAIAFNYGQLYLKSNTGAYLYLYNGFAQLESDGYITIQSAGYTHIKSSDNVYIDAGTGKITYFRFNGDARAQFNYYGFRPSVNQATLLGDTGYLWHSCYANTFYDGTGGYQDTQDDLAVMAEFQPKKTITIDPETRIKTVSETTEINPDTGLEYLDLLSIPRWMTNYDLVVKKLKEDNGDLLSDEDIDELIEDHHEAGWMLCRNISAFNDCTSGGVRQLDIEVKEVFELILSRLTNLENENKELKTRIAVLEAA